MNFMFTRLEKFGFGLLLLVGFILPGHATSILEIDTNELVDRAEVILEGEVIASEARWNAQQTYISTFVTFRVIEVLKGRLDVQEITQSFAGGTVDNTSLDVDGMVYPQVGERGIYFLENPGRGQANPMVGWGQGHFRVHTDSNGQERVLTEAGAPVTGMDDEATPAGRSAVQPSSAPLSHGVARGVRTAPQGSAIEKAMDRQSFKQALRQRIIARQQDSTDSATPDKPGKTEAER